MNLVKSYPHRVIMQSGENTVPLREMDHSHANMNVTYTLCSASPCVSRSVTTFQNDIFETSCLLVNVTAYAKCLHFFFTLNRFGKPEIKNKLFFTVFTFFSLIVKL